MLYLSVGVCLDISLKDVNKIYAITAELRAFVDYDLLEPGTSCKAYHCPE